ncbi:MAG: GDSL-type esterase/lipase family protein [Opitutaceae bacterium]
MHPKIPAPLVLIAACGTLFSSGLLAQSAGPAVTAPAAAQPAAASATSGARVEPKYGEGANSVNAPNRNDRPISYRVPTTAGWRTDWPERLEWDIADLKFFRESNEKLGPPKGDENRVVFIGDSITAGWGGRFATLFPNKPYIGRGIGSETTQQMLIRFRQDVIDLKPKVVVILAGTNDIAGNLGRSTDKMIQDNYISMIDLASLNQIKVVFCTIMPTTRYSWQPSVTDGAARVVVINKWIKEYAATRPGQVFFADVHTPMVGENNNMNPQLSGDGTHPNAAGYALISPMVEQKINQALAAK